MIKRAAIRASSRRLLQNLESAPPTQPARSSLSASGWSGGQTATRHPGLPQPPPSWPRRVPVNYPQVRVIPPGGAYFKWTWEKIHKAPVATQTTNTAYDPETPTANRDGTILDAVTKAQLNTGLTGQIRYRVSEKNLYAYLRGVKRPILRIIVGNPLTC